MATWKILFNKLISLWTLIILIKYKYVLKYSYVIKYEVDTYLHLFKKLSIFLFFLKAGKSKSRTKEFKPSCLTKNKKEEKESC